MLERKYYVNEVFEIWISSFLKILKKKGLIDKGELEEAFVQSLKEYREDKFSSVTLKEK